MQMAKGKQRQLFGDINITPLTDIFLVLLIIMMVVAPMMHQMRRDIKPPKVSTGSPLDQGPATIEVTHDGTFFMDGKEAPVSDLSTLLKARATEKGEKNVIIRADAATKSGAVIKVFEAARDAAYAKVTVAGEPLSGKRQTELKRQALPEEAP